MKNLKVDLPRPRYRHTFSWLPSADGGARAPVPADGSAVQCIARNPNVVWPEAVLQPVPDGLQPKLCELHSAKVRSCVRTVPGCDYRITVPWNDGDGRRVRNAVKWNGVTVLTDSFSICRNQTVTLPLSLGTLYVEALSCPHSPGPINIDIRAELSVLAPPGAYAYSIKADCKMDLGTPLACADVAMRPCKACGLGNLEERLCSSNNFLFIFICFPLSKF
jgi:hypothetical protein